MHITFIMVLLTFVNARKRIHGFPRTEKHKIDTGNNEEANQAIYQLPVDFKYLSRQGVGDTDFKHPFDGFRIAKLRDLNDIKQSVQTRNSSKNIHLMQKSVPVQYVSPRDEMEFYRNIYNNTDEMTKSRPFDFSSILEKNLADSFASKKIFGTQNTKKFPKEKKMMPRKTENVTGYFHENRFYRKPSGNMFEMNWTTCEEFAKNAVFHPDDIVNTKWLPFFIWSKRKFLTTVTHIFTYPTKKNVQFFKTNFGPHYINIDWGQPKLLLKERRNILLIAGDRKGLFYGIPEQQLPKLPLNKKLNLSAIPLRLKIHDPYLAMMYCDDYYATIMAELGTQPNSDHEALLEAATLNIKGVGRTVRRDIEEENFMANLKQKIKMEEEEKKFIRIYKPTGDIDVKVRHA